MKESTAAEKSYEARSAKDRSISKINAILT